MNLFNQPNNQLIDLLGVGIGPFNLSIAALLSSCENINSCFLEKNANFIWHPGMLLPEAEIQVSYLKDLVTLVDPTNPYSFIAFLAKQKRLYRFINANFNRVLRREFNQYLQWVSQQLPNLSFAEEVENIDFENNAFITQTSKRLIKSKHLVLGSGLTAYIPACAKSYLGKKVYHSKDFLLNQTEWRNKRIAVIGGGQSGAEVVQALLADDKMLPEKLTWITRRKHLSPIDDSAFTNELFTPNHSENFFDLSITEKANLLNEQTLASDGISINLLQAIYQRLYVLECVANQPQLFTLLSNQSLTTVHEQQEHYLLTTTHQQSKDKQLLAADIIILCTGYQQQLPAYLMSLRERISLAAGKFIVNKDFSIVWDGPSQHRIYVQNAARHSHGVADPNLSLMAWRSAKIINSLAEQVIYDIEDNSAAISWDHIYPLPLPIQNHLTCMLA